MKAEKKKFNISGQSLIFIGLFIAALAFMLWKCRFGLGGSDEAFYLTIPHRLCLGDELFRDEWHLSQLSAFFTLPFVSLYRAVNGSNDGIMLAARYVYVFGHAAVALVVWQRLKRLDRVSAPAAALIFMLFTPFDMMCWSYNTIAVDALVLSGVIAGTASDNGRTAWAVSGALFACAVVCCPYLASAYVLYFAAVTVCRAMYKKTAGAAWKNEFFTWRTFGFFTAGVAAVSALFLVFFFRHSGVSEVQNALPGIFSDPEHPGYSVVFMLKHYVYCLVTAHRFIVMPVAVYAVSLVLLAFDGKRREHAPFHIALAAVSALMIWALFLKNLAQDYYNGVMLPLVPVGFTAYLLLEKKPEVLFAAGFIPGVIYSFCVSATSNMGFLVMSMALSTANAASIVFIGLLVRQLRAQRCCGARAGTAAAVLPVLCLAALVIVIKASHCFWDESPAQLGSRISVGPARGIVTSERLSRDYMRIYDDMQYYSDKPRGNMLVYAQETWCCLMLDDYPYASFSAWLSGLNEETERRLALYYDMNPVKEPQYIYILKDNAFAQPGLDSAAVRAAAEENGFSVTENDVSWKLEK